MRHRCVSCAALIPVLLAPGTCGAAAPFSVPATAAGPPLLFEQRNGFFLARGRTHAWALASSGAWRMSAIGGDFLAMRLAGAVAGIPPRGRLRRSSRVTYLNRDGSPALRPPVFGEVIYRGVYRGVDLTYTAAGGELEYRFVLAPGTPPGRIRMRYAGARRVWIDAGQCLRIETAAGAVRHRRLRVHQPAPEGSRPAAARYVLRPDGSVSFVVDRYDPGLPLVIDPDLSYTSYLGGGESDYAYVIAVDAQGCAYIAGETASPAFPTEAPLQPALAGDRDLFIVKLNASGAAALYATYIGGASRETPRSIAVDSAGNAYVAGFTYSPDFPTTAGALRRSFAALVEGFVLKLNPAGSALVYSTFLGGTAANYPAALAVNGAGEAYVAGYTNSPDFPVTASAVQRHFAGTGYDAFLVHLDVQGRALLYSTYLGGRANDLATALVLDPAGNATLAGFTESSDFPVKNALFASPPGSGDAFIARFDTSGQLVFSTFLGGSGSDQAQAVALDSAGHLYVGGTTQSVNFPVTTGAYASANRGGHDAFLAELDVTGQTLLYATYLGGTGDEEARGIVVAASDSVWVAGNTTSADLPRLGTSGAGYHGGGDVFLANFCTQNNSLVLLMTAYLGGPDTDFLSGLAADGQGGVYLAGWTQAGLLASAAAFQVAPQGNLDGFVVKYSGAATTPACTAAAAAVTVPSWALTGNTADVLVTCTGGLAGAVYTTDLQVSLDAELSASAQPQLLVPGKAPQPAERSSNLVMRFRNVELAPAIAGTTLRIAGVQVRGPFTSDIYATLAAALAIADPRQRIAIVQSGSLRLQTAVLARSAVQSGCLPPDPVSRFNTSDVRVVLWWLVEGAAPGDVASVDWVAPDGGRYRTYVWPSVTAGGANCFWDVLPVAGTPASSKTGTWSVNVSWNGFALAGVQFTLSVAPQTPRLVWLNDTTRQVTVHFYAADGTTDIGWGWLALGGYPGWKVVAAADFDRNGVPDLVWLNDTTRQVTVHHYGTDGTTDIGWNWLAPNGYPGWKVVAAADFDGNGVPDLVWLNDTSRQVTVHFYGADGVTDIGWTWLAQNGYPGWGVVGAADFDRNGVPDLVWLNDTSRQVTVHYYRADGVADIGWAWLAANGYPGWKVAGIQ